MATKRCPVCQLVNPGSAQKCDCGYSFQDGSLGAPLDLSKPGAPQDPAAVRRFRGTAGLIWVVVLIVSAMIRLALRH